VLDVGAQYLEAPIAEGGLAAAEAVARMTGRSGPRDAATEPMDKWVARYNRLPSDELIRVAIEVVDRVLAQPSELVDLWAEGDDFNSWSESVAGPRARLDA